MIIDMIYMFQPFPNIGAQTILNNIRGVVKKHEYFTARLTVRVGGSAPSALTVSKCENFGPIFPIINW